jgi:hypothetical protein
MLRSEAIAIIKRGLGFRQTQDTAIIAALQEAQRDLELGHTLPSFLLAYDVVVPIVAGTALISLPTGFLRFHDDYELYYVNSNTARVFIPRRTYDEAYNAYVASGRQDDSALYTATATVPSVLVQRGKTQALLVPTPTTSFNAYLTYYKAALKLDAEIENAWLLNAPNVLIGMAGMTVAGNLRDKDAMTEFTRRANQGGKAFMGDIVEDELAGRPLIMGRNN